MAGETTTEEYGVSASLPNYVIETINTAEVPQLERVPDQQNAVHKEIHYDTRYELQTTVRGGAAPGTNGTVTVDGKTYIIDRVEKAGTYNGLRRWNVTGHCYTNCSSVTAATGSSNAATN